MVPALEAKIDRFARWAAVLGCVWFAAVAAWGLLEIPGGGHVGAGHAGTTMMAEAMLKWKSLYPLWSWYSPTEPHDPYGHHPYGMYYASAIALAIFGHKDFVPALPAIFMSAATPPLLYKIAKQHWGTVAGAAAVLGFVFLPITLGFSNFHNLEVMCIFGAALFFYGHSRFQATEKTRYLLASLAGVVVTCSADWIGYVLLAPVLGWALARAHLLPRWVSGPFRYAPYTRWWALSTAAAVGSLLFWLALFQKANLIADWLASASTRGGGDAVPLKDALEGRKAWIEFSFTPCAIFVGKVAAVVCAIRMLLIRRDEELYALAVLFAAVVQYVGFKRGADVHIYWPHYFGAYFALALAALSVSVKQLAGAIAARFAEARAAKIAAVAGLLTALAPPLLVAPDGIRSIFVWRTTGGRYNDNGALIRTHRDILFVIENVVKPAMPKGRDLHVHPSVGWGWEHTWALEGRGVPAGPPTTGGSTLWLGRASGMTADQMREFAAKAPLRIYGDAVVVDQRAQWSPIEAYSLHEREPNLIEWYLYSSVEPRRSITKESPDPFLTWEWRTHLGQQAAPLTATPASIEELRIAHNEALSRGDTEHAERYREQIEKQLDREVTARYDDGTRLIGVRILRGAQPRAECWFESGGPMQGDEVFAVHSVVERPLRLSWIQPDKVERDMAFAPPLSPKLWKKGWLYKTEVVFNHRIGEERYFGFWTPRDGSRAPRRTDGKPTTDIAWLR
jgi:hypothetical protein